MKTLILVMLLGAGFAEPGFAYEDDKRDPLVSELRGARFIGEPGLQPRFWMRPLNHVNWVGARDANSFMQPDDPVIAIVEGGKAWAIPWWIMKNHHVANLELNGRKRLITFCELCSSASGFYRDLDDMELDFTLAGAYQGSILIRDNQTGTLWAPFLGKGLAGSLKGKRLERFQVLQARWVDWQKQYPSSLVSRGFAGMRGGHGMRAVPGGDRPLGDLMTSSIVAERDHRLAMNRLVLGVEAPSGSKAYVHDSLASHGVVADTIGDFEIVLLALPESLMASAFQPVIDGRQLRFFVDQSGGFRDRETMSTWDVSGIAVAGRLTGRRLPFVPSGIEEWYIWSNYHPASALWPESAETAPSVSADG